MDLATTPNPGKTLLLDSARFGDLIRGTLKAILDIFQDTDKMEKSNGCKDASKMNKRKQPLPTASCSDPVENLSRTFADFKVEQDSHGKVNKTLATRTRWIIQDHNKLLELVTEAKLLIDGLQEITKSQTTIARLEGMMRYNIQQVKDMNTLQLLADVSQKGYPYISDAASIKVDILTINDNKRSFIETWAKDVGQEPEDNEMPDFESMTVTELKHHLRAITTKEEKSLKITPRDLDYVVLEYLNKKGYTRSSAIFEAEAISTAQEAPVLTSLANSSVSQPAEPASKDTLRERKNDRQHYKTRQSKRLRIKALVEPQR